MPGEKVLLIDSSLSVQEIGRSALEEAGKPKPLSIVEQINEILQEMVIDTPLASRSVRLVEDPREGVIVLVGLDRYKGVDSVPDPEIKLALRKAAGEWERRTGRVRR